MRSRCWPLTGTERELSLDEALSDPLIRAVMAADHVDPDRLAADLHETRRHLRRIST